MSPSDSSFTKVRRFGLTFKSFFMWSRTVYRGTPSSDDRFRVDFIGKCSMEAATAARSQARCLSPTPRAVLNISKSERSFFPNQQCRPSWWSLNKPFLERSHHLGHGLSRVLSLMNPHTCHQGLLDRVTCLCQPYGKHNYILWLRQITCALSWTLLPNYHFTLYCVLCCAV